MSRSYRKPYATCGYGGVARRFYKRLAAKRVRQWKEEIPDGRYYIKLSRCSWDICDYSFKISPYDEYYRKYFSK